MSSTYPPSSINTEEAFTDTSILLNYTLQQDDGEAEEILEDHDCVVIIGNSVQDEYKDVKDNRRELVKSLLKAEKDEGGIEEWTCPDSVDLNSNTQQYLEDLFVDLFSSDGPKVRRRLEIEENRLIRGWEQLFVVEDAHVDKVLSCERNPSVVGSLQSIVNNPCDVDILSEAVDWSTNGGTGTTISADHDDMVSNREEIDDTIEGIVSVDSIVILRPSEFLD